MPRFCWDRPDIIEAIIETGNDLRLEGRHPHASNVPHGGVDAVYDLWLEDIKRLRKDDRIWDNLTPSAFKARMRRYFNGGDQSMIVPPHLREMWAKQTIKYKPSAAKPIFEARVTSPSPLPPISQASEASEVSEEDATPGSPARKAARLRSRSGGSGRYAELSQILEKVPAHVHNFSRQEKAPNSEYIQWYFCPCGELKLVDFERELVQRDAGVV